MSKSIRAVLALLAVSALTPSAHAQSAAPYHLTASAPLGAPDRWDYLTFDGQSGRVYVAHVDHLSVVDGRSGALVGQVDGAPGGTHGIGISHATGLGFTDDGIAGQAVVFDLASLKVTAKLPAARDADGIAFDKATGHIFIVEGDSAQVQVFDPATKAMIATIPAGGALEFAVSDDSGHVYVNGAEKREIIRIDTHTNEIDARWPISDCVSPHGLAIDAVHHRLFSGCINAQMMVVDSQSGAIVKRLPIGKGSDAIAFDPKRERVFSPNGVDGTLSIYQETSPDSYTLLATLPTAVSGRTMTLDPNTGRLFIAAADTDPSPTPGKRAQVRSGTLKLLMFDPTN